MSAFIGYCFKKGAFLSSDSRRVSLVDGQVESDQIMKIRKLTNSIIVATGGLGSIGHQGMNILEQTISPDDDIDTILQNSTKIFSTIYSQFTRDNTSYSQTPLYVIFAGFDKSKSTGFIKILTNKDMFQKCLEIYPGNPYFTGSNTQIVVEEASKTYFKLKAKYDKFNLEKWSCESMQEISKLDSNVSLPVNLFIVSEFDIVCKIRTDSNFSNFDSLFEVDYPL